MSNEQEFILETYNTPGYRLILKALEAYRESLVAKLDSVTDPHQALVLAARIGELSRILFILKEEPESLNSLL